MSEITVRRGQFPDGAVRVRNVASAGSLSYYTNFDTGSQYSTLIFGFVCEHLILAVSIGETGIASWSYTGTTLNGTLSAGEDITKDGIARSQVSLKSNSNASTNVRLWAW